MIKHILKRLALLIPTLFGVITLVFLMIALAPGDPARVMLGERANAEQIAQLRAELGLDKPLIQQYGLYLSRVVRLDLGKSIATGQQIAREIADRFPATIELAWYAMIFATIVGMLLGVTSAIRRNTWVDYTTMGGALVGVSMPVFWLGLVLIMVFSVWLNLLPTGGRMNIRYYFTPITNFYVLDGIILWIKEGTPKYLWSAIQHLLLPTIALGTIPLAIIARTTRSSMLEVLQQAYIKTARSAGKAGNLPVRLEECAAAGDHGHRSPVRPVALRSDIDRDGVFLAGNRQVDLHIHRSTRLPCGAGWNHLHIDILRTDQSCRGYPLFRGES